ncbi:hypothetical protein DXG01_006031 [Tephrocybe rancida]|nr:hypothetical protein DXG01_006031 [Tephrocybe rancida]
MTTFAAFRSLHNCNFATISIAHARNFATSSRLQVQVEQKKAWVKNEHKPPPTAEDRKAKLAGPPRNAAIKHRWVRLVDPTTSKLTDLQPLRDILRSINTDSHYVELVSSTPDPIVKVFDKYLETTRAAEAAFRAREAARANVEKEVQMSWSAAPADLAHKVEKAREELARGARVILAFSRKSGQAKLTPAEMNARATEVVVGLEDVAKEWRAREVRAGQGILAIYLEATTRPTATEADAPAPEASTEPEGLSKKAVVYPNSTPTDLSHLVRRIRRDIAKGARVEVVFSAKNHNAPKGEEPVGVEKLQLRAANFFPYVSDVAKEWRKREYKPVSAKLIVFLEREGGPPKGRAVVHKGPKPKKTKPDDIEDLYQD